MYGYAKLPGGGFAPGKIDKIALMTFPESPQPELDWDIPPERELTLASNLRVQEINRRHNAERHRPRRVDGAPGL